MTLRSKTIRAKRNKRDKRDKRNNITKRNKRNKKGGSSRLVRLARLASLTSQSLKNTLYHLKKKSVSLRKKPSSSPRKNTQPIDNLIVPLLLPPGYEYYDIIDYLINDELSDDQLVYLLKVLLPRDILPVVIDLINREIGLCDAPTSSPNEVSKKFKLEFRKSRLNLKLLVIEFIENYDISLVFKKDLFKFIITDKFSSPMTNIFEYNISKLILEIYMEIENLYKLKIDLIDSIERSPNRGVTIGKKISSCESKISGNTFLIKNFKKMETDFKKMGTELKGKGKGKGKGENWFWYCKYLQEASMLGPSEKPSKCPFSEKDTGFNRWVAKKSGPVNSGQGNTVRKDYNSTLSSSKLFGKMLDFFKVEEEGISKKESMSTSTPK